MALSATLEADFGDGGFSLTGALDGVGGDLGAIGVPAVDIDGDSVTDAASLLDGVDSAAISATVAGVTEALGAVGVEIPAVDDLIGPLTAILDVGRQLASIDPSSLAATLEAGSEIEGGGLDTVEQRISAGVGVLGSGAVRDVLDLLGAALPGGLDLDGGLATLGTAGAAIKELILAVGGLMALETAVSDIADGAGLVTSMMPPSEMVAVMTRPASAAESELAALLVGVDPDDPGIVDLIAPLVRAWTADIRIAAEALTRGLGFGQATLIGLDLSGATERLDAAFNGLTEDGFDAVRTLAEQVVEWARPLLDVDLPEPTESLDQLAQSLRDRVGVLATAVDSLDPARLAGGLTAGLEPAVAFIAGVREAVEQVVVTVRSAIASVGALIDAIDLSPIIDAIQAVIEPIAEVIDTITSLIGDAQATIETASATVISAMDTVRSSMQGAADAVDAAFGRVQIALDALNLADLQATLESGIAPVANALAAAQVRPFFDTAVDIAETTADIVGAVPIGILPDDAKSELAEAVEPVKQIDIQAIVDELTDRMNEIVAKLDTDVLGAIEDAYRDVISFLESVDPNAPLEAFEAEVFDPFLEQLRAINPEEILRPLEDAIAPVQDAITGFDIGDELLAPIDDALDSVQEQVAEFQPSTLLAPIQTELDEVRDAVREALHLDSLTEWIDQAEHAVTDVLDQLDADRLIALFDRAFDTLVAEATSPLPGRNPLGSVVSSLLTATGIDARTDAFDAVASWIAGVPAGLGIQQRLVTAAEEVEALRDAVAGVDLVTVVGQLSPRHRALHDGVIALPAGSALRVAIEVEVTSSSPLELLGPFTAALDSYRTSLTTLAGELRARAASERQLADAVAAGLREALRPLNAIGDWVRALLARFGLDPAGKSIREIVSELLAVFTPSAILEPLTEALRNLLLRIRELATTGVFSPARAVISDVDATLAALDLGVLTDELDVVHAELVGKIDAIRPSVVLGDLLDSVEELQTELADFDPLGPVTDAVNAMTAAIDEGAEALRPTVIFAPAIDIYDQVVAALGALDVRALLDPLISALEAIAGQLDEGLDSLAAALKKLQDALPDAGELAAGGGASASVGLSVGI